MARKEMVIWYRDDENGGLLLAKDDIRELIPLYDTDYVVKFPGLAVTPENRAMLEDLLPKMDEEGTPLYLDELEDVEMETCDDVETPAEVLCYFRSSESIGTLDDCETTPAYEYWDGSNWKIIWYEDHFAEDVVLIDTDNYESLDTWDGSNMNFRSKFNHARLYPILEIDGAPVSGKYLFVQWTQYQGDIPKGEIIDEAQAQKLRIEVGNIAPKVLTQCTINDLRFAVIVIDGDEKTAAEAVWVDGHWDTNISYPALGVTVDEVAGAMDYDAVTEAGYTIID
jgi:hypothetical protein